MKKIIALFGYDMDNSVRPKILASYAELEAEVELYKDIRYFIVAFETEGNVWDIQNGKLQHPTPLRDYKKEEETD